LMRKALPTESAIRAWCGVTFRHVDATGSLHGLPGALAPVHYNSGYSTNLRLPFGGSR
jgi:hypothetical protein